jgi:hypothetical protein
MNAISGIRTRIIMAKVNMLRELSSPPLHYGDGSRSALMPAILDKASKGEL